MVKAVNGSVMEDAQRVNGKGVDGAVGVVNASSSSDDLVHVDVGSVRFLGRNIPGWG